jgi:hypothetical protein
MLTKEPSTEQRVHPSFIKPMQAALVRELPGRAANLSSVSEFKTKRL